MTNPFPESHEDHDRWDSYWQLFHREAAKNAPEGSHQVLKLETLADFLQSLAAEKTLLIQSSIAELSRIASDDTISIFFRGPALLQAIQLKLVLAREHEAQRNRLYTDVRKALQSNVLLAFAIDRPDVFKPRFNEIRYLMRSAPLRCLGERLDEDEKRSYKRDMLIHTKVEELYKQSREASDEEEADRFFSEAMRLEDVLAKGREQINHGAFSDYSFGGFAERTEDLRAHEVSQYEALLEKIAQAGSATADEFSIVSEPERRGSREERDAAIVERMREEALNSVSLSEIDFQDFWTLADAEIDHQPRDLYTHLVHLPECWETFSAEQQQVIKTHFIRLLQELAAFDDRERVSAGPARREINLKLSQVLLLARVMNQRYETLYADYQEQLSQHVFAIMEQYKGEMNTLRNREFASDDFYGLFIRGNYSEDTMLTSMGFDDVLNPLEELLYQMPAPEVSLSASRELNQTFLGDDSKQPEADDLASDVVPSQGQS